MFVCRYHDLYVGRATISSSDQSEEQLDAAPPSQSLPTSRPRTVTGGLWRQGRVEVEEEEAERDSGNRGGEI